MRTDPIKPMYLNTLEEFHLSEAHKKYDNDPEKVLGMGLLEPFEPMNSSSRKIMGSNQAVQTVPLIHPEVAFISTGYENKYGDKSSSIIKATKDWRILAKIQNFSSHPNKKYTAVLFDPETNTVDIQKRTPLKHNTEIFGYEYNNPIDEYVEGDLIAKDTVLRTSSGFDEYMNHADGVNLNCIYLSSTKNNNDPVIISESAAKKLSIIKVHNVVIDINENQIPTNIYGDSSKNIYKIMPDIGEAVEDSIVCNLRVINNNEILYSLINENLDVCMQNDMLFRIPCSNEASYVEDIKISCNNKDIENSTDACYSQINYYLSEQKRYCREFVSAVERYVEDPDYHTTYDLDKEYYLCKRQLEDTPYIDDGTTINIRIELTIKCIADIENGDKIANRHGGKGVVSYKVPDEEMPRVGDTIVDMIWNISTVVNRLNPNQLVETTINCFSRKLIEYMSNHFTGASEAIALIYRFYNYINPEFAQYFLDAIDYATLESTYDEEDLNLIIDTLLGPDYDSLYITAKPITNLVDLDKLNELYKFMQSLGIEVTEYLDMPITGSDGKIRFVKSNKKGIIGSQYIRRLKQSADDKHSSISLSSTNIRNENTKSKATKNHTDANGGTPVRNGVMEALLLLTNLGAEQYIKMNLKYCSSPTARISFEQDMYNKCGELNFHLTCKDKNKIAEACMALLISRGLEFRGIKYRKKYKPAFIKKVDAFTKENCRRKNPFSKYKRDAFSKKD